MKKALKKENSVDSQSSFSVCEATRGKNERSWIDATGPCIFQGHREPPVRIKTKVTGGMRFHCVEAAKRLRLKRDAPKITRKVWTQNICTKLRKFPGHEDTQVTAGMVGRKAILSTVTQKGGDEHAWC